MGVSLIGELHFLGRGNPCFLGLVAYVGEYAALLCSKNHEKLIMGIIRDELRMINDQNGSQIVLGVYRYACMSIVFALEMKKHATQLF